MKMSARYRMAIIAFTLSVVGRGMARALVIDPTFGASITSDPNVAVIEAGIDATIQRVEADIANPITVTIDFQEMTTGLGLSQTTTYDESYSSYRSWLANNQILSANDTTALASLPNQAANPVTGNSSNSSMTIAAPLLRSLGQTAAGGLTSNGNSGGTFDGDIGLNTSIMNLSRTGTQNAGYYDLQAVAGHEIDEVLGIGGTGSTLSSGDPSVPTTTGVLDLFRYSASGVRSFNLNPNVNAYFSINGGNTNLVYFDQNNEGADFSDWGNGTANAEAGNTPPQLQDSFGTPGADTNIGVNELTALDVVGYNLISYLTWNPTGGTSSTPVDGSGTWTTASGSIWWNGTVNSAWSNSTVQNAQFGTAPAGAPSTTQYTVTLGSQITVGTLTFSNQNYTINRDAGGMYSLTINNGIFAEVNGTINAPVILGGTNSWNANAGVTLTTGGAISGGFGITLTGPGTVLLTGANSYSGATTISAGTLQFGKIVAMSGSSAVSVASGATLAVNAGGTGEFTNGASGNGTIGGLLSGLGGQSGSTVSFVPGSFFGIDTTNSAGSLTYSGNITNSGLGLVKLGTGTLVLSGTSTYSGGTTVNAGTLTAQGVSGLGGATGPLAVNNLNTGAGTATVLNLSTTAATTTGPLSSTIATPSSGTNSAAINMGGGQTFTVNQTAAGIYSGVIAGSGSFQLGGSSTSTLTLSGANTYSGGTTISGGTLQYAKTASMSASSAVSVASGGTLAVNAGGTGEFTNGTSGNGTIGGLLSGLGGQSGSTVSFSSGSFLGIDTTNSGGSLTYSGNITNPIGLIKLGPGTLTLSGANTYTGSTTVSVGTLTAGAANALPSGTAVTIGTAATTTALLNTGGFAQTISSLTIYAPPYTDGNPTTVVNVGTGTLGIHGNISLFDSTGGTGAGYNQGAEIDAGTGGTIDLGGVVRTITVAGQGTGVTPGDFVINAIIANGGINFTGNPSSAGDGPTGMTLGASAPNTYAGGTTVDAGTLNVASTTTLGASTGALTLNTTGNVASEVILNSSQTIGSLQTGTLGTGTATVDLNGTAVALTDSQTASTTYAGAITGRGSLTKAGAGSLTLSGANTYTGTTTLTSGTLILGTTENPGISGPLGKSPANNPGSIVLNGGWLEYSGAINTDYSGRFSTASDQQYNVNLSGSNPVLWSTGLTSVGGSLNVSGSGTMTLDGYNSFSGPTTVTQGILCLDGSLAETTSVNVASGASLYLYQNNIINSAARLTLSSGVLNARNSRLKVADLTSTGTSTLDLGVNSNAAILSFAASNTDSWTGTLTIQDWNGDSIGNGPDQVFFGSTSSGLTDAQLSEIDFLNPTVNGIAEVGNYPAAILSDGEVVAAPEPGTRGMIVSGIAMLFGVGTRCRRSVATCLV
jgi:autotransporter-associated beta strand protein